MSHQEPPRSICGKLELGKKLRLRYKKWYTIICLEYCGEAKNVIMCSIKPSNVIFLRHTQTYHVYELIKKRSTTTFGDSWYDHLEPKALIFYIRIKKLNLLTDRQQPEFQNNKCSNNKITRNKRLFISRIKQIKICKNVLITLIT